MSSVSISRDLRMEFEDFRRGWADEDLFPFWRSPAGGRSLHRRECRLAESYIRTYMDLGNPTRRVGFPKLVTAAEALTPRRPQWRACKFCAPDVHPPIRVRMPLRDSAEEGSERHSPGPLAEFLLERIAEDEQAARLADSIIYSNSWRETINRDIRNSHHAAHMRRQEPARVIVACEARRRVVEHETKRVSELAEIMGYAGPPYPRPFVLRLLALPYADHPDYREEWKP